MFFILKNNMGWKESIYKEAIEKMQSIENEIVGIHKEIVKDMNVVNATRIP